jgi:hypothetical protein
MKLFDLLEVEYDNSHANFLVLDDPFDSIEKALKPTGSRAFLIHGITEPWVARFFRSSWRV